MMTTPNPITKFPQLSIIARIVAICSMLVFIAFICLNMPQWSNAANQPDNVTVYFFHGAECIHCHTVMPFMNATFEKYPNVKFEVLETFHNESNNALFVEMNKKRGIEQYGVPEIFVGDVVLIGSKDIPEKLDGILENITKNKR